MLPWSGMDPTAPSGSALTQAMQYPLTSPASSLETMAGTPLASQPTPKFSDGKRLMIHLIPETVIRLTPVDTARSR